MAAHVYYTVNSGLYFSDDNTGIFIDGIHGGADVGFSPVHPKTVSECAGRIGIFHDLRALLFTHCHSDHFDAVTAAGLTEKEQPSEKETVPLFLYTPENPLSRDIPGVTIEPAGTDGTLRICIGDFEIITVRTRHDGGKPLCFTPHVSFVINTPDETFFAAGDAVFTDQSAGQIRSLCRHPVRAAFVNPYQLLLESDREFLTDLSADCHVLIHLPLPKDDRYTVKLLYDNAVKKYPEQMPELLLPGFYTQLF